MQKNAVFFSEAAFFLFLVLEVFWRLAAPGCMDAAAPNWA